MAVVGVVPAAGFATRLQPLPISKEMLAVGTRPVMDYIVVRMRAGGCTRLRIVTRPEKEDVITHAVDLGAEVVLGHPESVSASLHAGIADLADDDIVLIGFPDSLWEPVSGYRRLVEAVRNGADVALGLFRIDPKHLTRSDVVVFGPKGTIAGVDVKPSVPASDWIWGCAAGRAALWAGLDQVEWPGALIDVLCREGRDVRGIELSDVWLDVGTKESLARAYAVDLGEKGLLGDER
jgi:dTDP-glucose pyrophosphorylase